MPFNGNIFGLPIPPPPGSNQKTQGSAPFFGQQTGGLEPAPIGGSYGFGQNQSPSGNMSGWSGNYWNPPPPAAPPLGGGTTGTWESMGRSGPGLGAGGMVMSNPVGTPGGWQGGWSGNGMLGLGLGAGGQVYNPPVADVKTGGLSPYEPAGTSTGTSTTFGATQDPQALMATILAQRMAGPQASPAYQTMVNLMGNPQIGQPILNAARQPTGQTYLQRASEQHEYVKFILGGGTPEQWFASRGMGAYVPPSQQQQGAWSTEYGRPYSQGTQYYTATGEPYGGYGMGTSQGPSFWFNPVDGTWYRGEPSGGITAIGANPPWQQGQVGGQRTGTGTGATSTNTPARTPWQVVPGGQRTGTNPSWQTVGGQRTGTNPSWQQVPRTTETGGATSTSGTTRAEPQTTGSNIYGQGLMRQAPQNNPAMDIIMALLGFPMGGMGGMPSTEGSASMSPIAMGLLRAMGVG